MPSSASASAARMRILMASVIPLADYLAVADPPLGAILRASYGRLRFSLLMLNAGHSDPAYNTEALLAMARESLLILRTTTRTGYARYAAQT